jgi:hypothetical protein
LKKLCPGGERVSQDYKRLEGRRRGEGKRQTALP